ncbi:MAG: hypothetical protein ACXWD3_19025 [Mycobacterium sp.]
MAAACMLYLAALTILGRRANGWLEESIIRRFENAELVRLLERRVDERTVELHQVNEQLHRDIAERRRALGALAKYGERQAAVADFGRLALSGIDLETLFCRAVALVRDRLDVPGAVVLEGAFDAPYARPRAAIGLPPPLPTQMTIASLSDHAVQPLNNRPGDCGVDLGAVDLGRLEDPKSSVAAAIVPHGRAYGMLVAVADALTSIQPTISRSFNLLPTC